MLRPSSVGVEDLDTESLKTLFAPRITALTKCPCLKTLCPLPYHSLSYRCFLLRSSGIHTKFFILSTTLAPGILSCLNVHSHPQPLFL